MAYAHNTLITIPGTDLPVLDGTATPAEVILGKEFYNTDAANKLIGTLELSGTASASEVLSPYTFYAKDGTKLTGTFSFSGTATASDITAGRVAYTNSNSIVTGTRSFSASDVAATDIASGKTAYNSNGTLIEGTRNTGIISGAKMIRAGRSLSGSDGSAEFSNIRNPYVVEITDNYRGVYYAFGGFSNPTNTTFTVYGITNVSYRVQWSASTLELSVTPVNPSARAYGYAYVYYYAT